jgi:hypothetical protein
LSAKDARQATAEAFAAVSGIGCFLRALAP